MFFLNVCYARSYRENELFENLKVLFSDDFFNWGPDWGSDDEDDSYELSYDDSGSMLQSPFGRAIDMGNGQIPYCVNGQWNEDDQKCDCFPGFVESQDEDEV